MLKAVGGFLILAGCIGFGGNRIREEQGRIRHLQELIRIIRRIQNEMVYGKHTLPEICQILSVSSQAPYQEAFDTIYRRMRQEETCLDGIWEQEMTQSLRRTRLREEEREILRNLPRQMGIREEKYQAESIGQSMDLLVRKCRQAEESYENKSRVIFSLSILTGVFLIILLL